MKSETLKYCLIILTSLIAGCANNGARWMQDSKNDISNKNVTQLIIPGSHIANGYGISSNDKMCLGEIESQSYSNNGAIQQTLSKESTDEINQQLFIDELNTQNFDVSKQLNHGIRYLDIQICRQNDVFYTSNLYLTDKFEDIAEQIKSFLLAHPLEIVILDLDNNLRGEYGYLNQTDIKKLHDYLKYTFGEMIVPKTQLLSTVSQLQNQHFQLIILSSNPILNSYSDIWDKNQTTFLIDSQSATIKKLGLLETLLNDNKTENKLTILPIYSDIRIENLRDNDDSEADQAILLNYLQQNIANHPGIIVANKINAPYLENLIIQGDINSNFISKSESKVSVESIAFESAAINSIESSIESNAHHNTAPGMPVAPLLNPNITTGQPKITLPY
jgi:hypothetical protein